MDVWRPDETTIGPQGRLHLNTATEIRSRSGDRSTGTALEAFARIDAVEWIDWPAHVLEAKLAIVRRADTAASTFDDRARDRLEADAVVDAALQHQEAALRRVDP